MHSFPERLCELDPYWNSGLLQDKHDSDVATSEIETTNTRGWEPNLKSPFLVLNDKRSCVEVAVRVTPDRFKGKFSKWGKQSRRISSCQKETRRQ